MENMIAFCGIVYTECPGFTAAQMDSDEEKRKVVELWSKMYRIHGYFSGSSTIFARTGFRWK